jgi:hypothetical protein
MYFICFTINLALILLLKETWSFKIAKEVALKHLSLLPLHLLLNTRLVLLFSSTP